MRFFLLVFPLFLFGQSAEMILEQMTLEEKIGQLFVASVCPPRTDGHLDDLMELMQKCCVGNVIVKQSGVEDQIRVLNALQRASKVPLLVMADAEWGLAMRIDGTRAFPKNMTLGAVADLGLIERVGEEVGRQARLVGIHMSLAPVVDVNNNPKNPIIHMRSFGDLPDEVGKRGVAMMRGLQKGGLLTCAKHFPGHGDTVVDSHVGLPVIAVGMERLEMVELPPFQACIDAGVDAVMPAHILFPALDDVPATLSYPIITGLLREKMGFKGLIVTDGLSMKALKMSPEEVALGAHAAGCDLLLYGDHISEAVDEIILDLIPRAFGALLDAYRNGRFSISRLDESVLKILKAKAQFSDWTVESGPDLSGGAALVEELFEAAITQVGPDLTPIDPDAGYLSLGNSDGDEMVSAFCPCGTMSWEDRENLFDCETAVVSLRNIKPLNDEEIAFFERLSEKVNVTYCLFGTPYAIKYLPKGASILVGYEAGAQKAMLKVLYGEKKAVGKLPIRALE